jgi:hypothetical protein
MSEQDPRPPEPWQARIGADVRQVPTSDLRRLELVLTEVATWTVLGLGDRARLVLVDLAAELAAAASWRSTEAWMLEQQVFEGPEPGEPTRVALPPGWRRPDEEAVGL